MHSFIKRQSSGTFEWPVPGSTRQSIHQKKIPHPFFLVSSAVALCEQRFSMLFMFYAFAFAAFHILFATVKGQIQNLIVRITEKKCLCLHALVIKIRLIPGQRWATRKLFLSTNRFCSSKQHSHFRILWRVSISLPLPDDRIDRH